MLKPRASERSERRPGYLPGIRDFEPQRGAMALPTLPVTPRWGSNTFLVPCTQGRVRSAHLPWALTSEPVGLQRTAHTPLRVGLVAPRFPQSCGELKTISAYDGPLGCCSPCTQIVACIAVQRCNRFIRWYDEKYGGTRSGRDWVKAHCHGRREDSRYHGCRDS